MICNFENIEHLPHPDRFLKRAASLLSDEGVLLVSTPDRLATPPFKDGKPDNPFHVNEWYRQEFASLLGEEFESVEMMSQVESYAHCARLEALAALRQGMFWGNPPLIAIWRKLRFGRSKQERPWKQLAGLAAPSPADYPILPLASADLLGKPFCHFAICKLRQS